MRCGGGGGATARESALLRRVCREIRVSKVELFPCLRPSPFLVVDEHCCEGVSVAAVAGAVAGLLTHSAAGRPPALSCVHAVAHWLVPLVSNQACWLAPDEAAPCRAGFAGACCGIRRTDRLCCCRCVCLRPQLFDLSRAPPVAAAAAAAASEYSYFSPKSVSEGHPELARSGATAVHLCVCCGVAFYSHLLARSFATSISCR